MGAPKAHLFNARQVWVLEIQAFQVFGIHIDFLITLCFLSKGAVKSEVVESIVLPIHEHLNDPLGVGGGCGGNSLSVRLKTGSEQSCLTQEIASFSAGQIKSWSGQTLGSCKDFKLDNSTKVQVLTQSYYNGYCLVNGVEIKTKSLTYFCNIGDDWRYSTNNDDTFSCRHWWHNWTTEQQNSRTTVSTSHTPSPSKRRGVICKATLLGPDIFKPGEGGGSP